MSTPHDSSNSTNFTHTTSSTTFHLYSTSIYSILCLAGLIAYFLYCFVVIRNRKSLANPFYAFTVSMAIPDCLTNSITLFYAVPVIIHNSNPIDESTGESTGEFVPYWIRDTLGFVSDWSWFLICIHMVLIASDRVISLRWSSKYNQLFSRGRVICLLVGAYSMALIIPSITYHCSCRYEVVDFAWGLACYDQNTTRLGCDLVSLIDTIWTNAQIGYVLLCDAFILIYVYNRGRRIQPNQNNQARQQRHAKRELALILQFTSIALILIVGQSIFWCMPIIVERGHMTPNAVGFLSMLLGVSTCSLNPYLYFVFSSEIRKRLMTTVCRRKTDGGGVQNHGQQSSKNGQQTVVDRRMSSRRSVHLQVEGQGPAGGGMGGGGSSQM